MARKKRGVESSSDLPVVSTIDAEAVDEVESVETEPEIAEMVPPAVIAAPAPVAAKGGGHECPHVSEHEKLHG